MKRLIITRTQSISVNVPGEYLYVLSKPDIELTLSARFEVAGSEQQKVCITIHHKAPRTVARTSLRGTSADRAKLTLFGRIIIDPKCPQSNSFLEERILLLSPNARGEAVPELEILTDDVKCSHAASISSLDKNQLFYLQSRGLKMKLAEKLLVESFLA